MLILNYASKKDLKAAVGQKLNFIETSIFGPEYRADGKFSGCNRPTSRDTSASSSLKSRWSMV